MHEATIAQLAQELKSRKISSQELTKHFLERISRLDEDLNAFITITQNDALAQAKAADARLASGEETPLTGIPIAHKDIFCTKGVKTSCGSRMLDNFISPYDATVVARLKKAGAVMLGKTNMDEFAMGSSNETSFYGPAHNPWDRDKVPGGSSGGSAAAVAARMACGATGTDTGGSIRQPAAFSGVTGVKPTYGRVSRYGIVAFASSLDQAGTLTRTAEDAALMLQIMSGPDELDSTALPNLVPDFCKALKDPWENITIGVPDNFFDKGLDPNNAQLIRDALSVFEKLGATIKEIHLENIHLSVPVYYVVAPAEASSNLSRFDGIRYGYRTEGESSDLAEFYMRTRGEGFGAEVKRRILMGTYVLSAGYYDAYYLQAQKIRQLISQDFSRAFEDVDLIAGPTAPTPAFSMGQKIDDPVQMYLNDIYTIGASLAGLPALSTPCGLVNNLPVGLQLIGPHLSEERLLKAAHYFQQETDWHALVPPGYID